MFDLDLGILRNGELIKDSNIIDGRRSGVVHCDVLRKDMMRVFSIEPALSLFFVKGMIYYADRGV